MDNNMIHIDDLVRQRLRGGEEPERPGAWLTMRELLDKEMPVSAGVNWRRMIGYFTALLLISTASVGGYRVYNSRVANTRITSGGGGGSENEEQVTAPAGLTVTNASLPKTANSDEPIVSGSSISVNSNVEATHPKTGNSSRIALNTPNTDRTNYVAGDAHSAAQSVSSIQGEASTTAEQVASVHGPSAVTTSGTGNQNTASAKTTQSAGYDKRVYASASANVHGHRKQTTPAELNADDVHALQSASAGKHNPVNVGRPELTVKHDTIERLELVYRRLYDAGAQKMYYRIDTFPAGKIVVDRIVPSQQEVTVTSDPAKPHRGFLHRRRDAQRDKTEAGSSLAMKQSAATPAAGTKPVLAEEPTVVPAAAIAAKTPEQEVGTALVSLAAARVSTKHFTLWDAEKVDAAINKFKFNLAKIQMYPGVMGGINASLFTPNALGGFQLGLTSLFVLNDWWSLMTEFKYIYRYNTGSSVRDNYMGVKDGSGQIQTTTYQGQQYLSYNWTDQTIQHSFNYDAVKTFELPLMLRYNWGRLYAQGGVNLVFSSAISAKEVTNALGDYKSHTELRPNVHTPDSFFIRNDHPNVQLSDFGSHFGTGYVISGGYMFSPAIYFDARITQTFWDNSKTSGAQQVSKDLLRTPSIQLSVGYRFNSKK